MGSPEPASGRRLRSSLVLLRADTSDEAVPGLISRDNDQSVEHRRVSRALLALLVAGGAAAILLLVVLTTPHAPSGLETGTSEQLADEKLRQEILNLQRQRSFLVGILPLISALAAATAVLLTWRKQLGDAKEQQRDRARQQDLDREQSKAAMEQRNSEHRRRLQEDFAAIASSLGSESVPVQASAAVSLLSFLQPELEDFHEQVYLLVLANLKVDHHREVNKLLIRVFERALRIELRTGSLERALVLDLASAQLEKVELAGLDLADADLAFANLRYSNLRGANLRRAKGYKLIVEKASLSGVETQLAEVRFRKAHCAEAQFHDANLVSARFEEADLTKTEFQRAKLQSAHLDETVLIGTRFEGADLNDAFFRRLRAVDEVALRSVSRADNWRAAHFDDDIFQRIHQLSGQGATNG